MKKYFKNNPAAYYYAGGFALLFIALIVALLWGYAIAFGAPTHTVTPIIVPDSCTIVTEIRACISEADGSQVVVCASTEPGEAIVSTIIGGEVVNSGIVKAEDIDAVMNYLKGLGCK